MLSNLEPTIRIVVQFSCGAASAVAARLALSEYGHDRVVLVNAFIEEEDSDNRRFLVDCEKWLDHPVVVLRDEKFGASVREVWRRKRFIKGQYGAPCSMELKRKPLNDFARPEDVYVLGYTAEEEDRYVDFLENNPGRRVIVPLIERNLFKTDCLAMIDNAGIQLPRMYLLGFDNANCKGCPKGGINYWQHIRYYFPEDFEETSALQQEIGPGASFLQFRSGPRKGERMSLAELPPGRGNMSNEPSFSCSFFCQMTEDDMVRRELVQIDDQVAA